MRPVHEYDPELEPVREFDAADLVGQSVIDDLAAAARRHRVHINVSVMPYDEEDTDRE